MNAQRLRAVANAICRPKEGDPQFNMGNWAVKGKSGYSVYSVGAIDCGTTCCIAGWACHLFVPKDAAAYFRGFHTEARQVLGLTTEQSEDLFYGRFRQDGMSMTDITAEEAAAELRRLADLADELAAQ